MFLITQEKPRVILGKDVTAYAGSMEFLAAGFAHGEIKVWSDDWPCSHLKLPGKQAAQNIWWNGNSPFLGVSGENPSQVYVYDLQRCALVTKIKAQGAVEQFTVSHQGEHMAYVDAGRRLWSAPLTEEPQQQATLRFDPLALNITPKSGLIMAADRSGWLIIWELPDYQILDQEQIPGGPFQKARFEKTRLKLQPEDHPQEMLVWDILEARELDSAPGHNPFVLENQVLHFVFPEKKWLKKALFADPGLEVSVDPKHRIFQVLDLDGQSRYYSALSGEQIQDPPQDQDQKSLQVPASGSFSWQQIEYRLADPVVSKADWALWCRYIPGQGYYLWWAPYRSSTQLEFEQELPRRENIRAEIPPDWSELDTLLQNESSR
ncbi:MAG: hypothetical protein ACOCY9_00100 [Desulfohalobiaceae bacterium]